LSQTDPYNATIVQRWDQNEYTSIFTVRPDSGACPPFEPGQFTTLGLIDPDAPPKKDGRKPMILRAYSIASSPTVRETMEFYIILVDNGKLTPKLWKLREGDRLWLSPKISGEFTLDGVPADRDMVWVSTGTGIAPFVSMYRRYRGQNRWKRAVVINGCRLARDLGYVSEFERYAREDGNCVYLPTVTREPEGSDWKGLRGRVPLALEPQTYEKLVGAPLVPEQCHVFLCGNPQMIDDVEAMLLQRGFKTHKKRDPGNIHLERYW